MAVDIKRTWYQHVDVQPIVTGQTVSEEGQVLAAIMEGGIEKVKPTTGTSDKIAGFAVFRQKDYTTKPEVENVVVPSNAPYTVQLSHGNITTGPSLRVHSATLGDMSLVLSTPSVSGQVKYDLTTGLLTFAAADKGLAMTVYYTRDLTLFEALQIYQQAPINYPDPNYFKAVGVGKGKGRIFTAFFNQAVDWTSATPTAGANGFITTGGSAIPGVRVVAIPTATNPVLGLEFLV